MKTSALQSGSGLMDEELAFVDNPQSSALCLLMDEPRHKVVDIQLDILTTIYVGDL